MCASWGEALNRAPAWLDPDPVSFSVGLVATQTDQRYALQES
jgi:hypothetical protein